MNSMSASAVSRCGSRRASPTARAGAGQALVCLHGIGSSSAGWLCQLETLKGYRLIAWDAPGYGESEFLPLAEPRPADYAQALHEFLDRLLLKDVVLVANSLGCLMAGAYAAAHRERVRSMVLLGTRGRLRRAGRSRGAGCAAGWKSWTSSGRRAWPRSARRRWSAKGSPPIALELVRWTQRRIRPQGYRQALHCLAQGRLAERCAALPEEGAGRLRQRGHRSRPKPAARRSRGAFPRGEYRSLAGIGHVPHIEAPGRRCNDLIAGFVPRNRGQVRNSALRLRTCRSTS